MALSSSPNKITLKDVALRAGVTSVSASAVLNGSSANTRVSEVTRERILQVAKELGYRPNLGARSLKKGSSRQIGVLIRNNASKERRESGAHPLSWEFVLGINHGLEENGYIMSLVRLCDLADSKELSAQALQGHLLEGIIVVNHVPALSAEHVESLAPVCLWLDADVWRDESCLRRDERNAGRIVARELAALGYRKIVLLRRTGEPINSDVINHRPSRTHYSHERLEGLAEVGATHDLEFEEYHLPAEHEKEAIANLWPKLSPQIAVVALDAYAAYVVMQRAAMDGQRIGVDFALACCDDGFHTVGLSLDAISRVHFDRYEMGVEAARMMSEMLASSNLTCPSRILTGQWLVGESTPNVFNPFYTI